MGIFFLFNRIPLQLSMPLIPLNLLNIMLADQRRRFEVNSGQAGLTTTISTHSGTISLTYGALATTTRVPHKPQPDRRKVDHGQYLGGLNGYEMTAHRAARSQPLVVTAVPPPARQPTGGLSCLSNHDSCWSPRP